ncbi:unnamed protein product, partial [Gulo gulo]
AALPLPPQPTLPPPAPPVVLWEPGPDLPAAGLPAQQCDRRKGEGKSVSSSGAQETSRRGPKGQTQAHNPGASRVLPRCELLIVLSLHLTGEPSSALPPAQEE